MRRQLILLVAATTSLVLLAFLVPLGVLLQRSAADRAVSSASREANSLSSVVATTSRDVLSVIVNQAAHDDVDGFQLTVFLPDGTSLGEPAPRTPGVALAALGRSLIVDTGGGREVLVAVVGVDAGTAVVRVFVPGSELREGVSRAWVLLAVLAVVLFGLSLVVADRLAVGMVGPMRGLAEVSRRLGAGELDARVRLAGPSELRAVGAAVNHLASRIGELLARERESVADLSHRLRTPLTALRLDAESLGDQSEADRLSRDVDALTRMVDSVIDQARRPVREGIAPRCDAVAVGRERMQFWSPLAEDEGRDVTIDLPKGPLLVRLSAQDLSSALDALIGNVFGHTPVGTAFTVQVAARPHQIQDTAGSAEGPGGAVITVRDDGPGLPARYQPRRGHSTSNSTGLGLDIARRTAEASGGRMEMATGPAGAMVTLVLGSADERQE